MAHYPRIQILTIEELLNGKRAEYPRGGLEATFRRAPCRRSPIQLRLAQKPTAP